MKRAAGLGLILGFVSLNVVGLSGSVGAATIGPEITIEADDGETFPQSYDVADRLEPGTVLRVRVTGFQPFARAVAEQCAPNARGCGNRVPVQFGDNGEAQFQYLVTNDFLPGGARAGGCRADAAPCTIVVRAVKGATRGEIQTVFVDPVPPAGRIEVSSSTGLSLGGEKVTVAVRDYPAGARVTAVLCGAPDATGERCGEPGPTAALVIGRDGTGHTELRVEPGRVGAEGVPCFRGDDCGISVVSEDVFARAPVVPISFAAPPGADYDPNRVRIGLAIAVVLLGVAVWLIFFTDWSAVGEEAAPEIDEAEYADLDAIIAALPPEEEEELAASR